jgi:hypothetical protein
MSRAARKKAVNALQTEEASAILDHLSERRGAPMRDSIKKIEPLTPQPKGAAMAAVSTPRFLIIKTTERDEYELKKTPSSAARMGVAAAKKPHKPGEAFGGTDRKAAKLSIATGALELFKDVKDLIESLPAEIDMTDHHPPITREAKSGRVNEEQRNVSVNAFIYAASRENDNDFHLILGRDLNKSPERYMTMELSGLPPDTSDSFESLKAVRDAYKGFFGAQLPGETYDFYDPPIPVKIQGSLFFDITHSTGGRPGPKSLKSRMPVIWEVHPITKIEFK